MFFVRNMFFADLHKLLVSTSSGAKVPQFEFVSGPFSQKAIIRSPRQTT
jgi:hypothetical protein